MIVLDGNDSHDTLAFLRPSWLVEGIGGVPPDKLGASATFGTTDSGVVKILLDFGRLVGIGLPSAGYGWLRLANFGSAIHWLISHQCFSR